jgi:hypothetical protein
MIYFPSLGSFGRLGNQLFQYSAGRSLALHHNTDLCVLNLDNMEWHGQKCLLSNFNINVNIVNKKESCKHVYKEGDPFKINEDFFSTPDDTLLEGFFQSKLYFEKYEDIIKKELTPKKLKSNFINNVRSKVKKPLASIHVRRGDNTDFTNIKQHALREAFSTNGIYSRYIEDAIAMFPDHHFVVFSGGKRGDEDNRDDIKWCKQFFQGNNFSFSENNSTMEDFCSIMLCDNNIISHVSSFGWWAAYLNPNDNKTVIAPKNYHPDRPNYSFRKGFYPADWRLI